MIISVVKHLIIRIDSGVGYKTGMCDLPIQDWRMLSILFYCSLVLKVYSCLWFEFNMVSINEEFVLFAMFPWQVCLFFFSFILTPVFLFMGSFWYYLVAVLP